MKNKLLSSLAITAASAMLAQMPLVQPVNAQDAAVADVGSLSCVRSRLTIQDPKVVQVARDKAMVKMKVTNNLGWPITQVFLQYSVSYKANGGVLTSDPVSLTIPGGLAPGATTEIQTGFFGLEFMQSGLADGASPASAGSRDAWQYRSVNASQAQARVSVLDAQDPNGNQLVFSQQIIGLGWTGMKSPQSCS